MKHLKSTSQNLKEIFEKTITVNFIAEPLRSFDVSSEASEIKSFIAQQDYDVIGIREKGLMIGYVLREELSDDAVIASICHPFNPTELVNDTANLVEVFKILRTKTQVYVSYLNQVCGIVTKGDLQKAPVRMWLFGLVSLLEMQLLRVIRGCYPNELWREKNYLTDNRIKKAEEVFNKRKADNEEIDLADCLQFCDKREILKSSGKIKTLPGMQSPVKDLLKKVEKLRDKLAHGQNIISGSSWSDLAETIEQTESLLKVMEKVNF